MLSVTSLLPVPPLPHRPPFIHHPIQHPVQVILIPADGIAISTMLIKGMDYGIVHTQNDCNELC